MRKKTTEDVENVEAGAESKAEKKPQKRKTQARKATTTRKKDATEKAEETKTPDADTTEKAGKQPERKNTRRSRRPSPKAKKEIEAIVATLQQENTSNPVEEIQTPVVDDIPAPAAEDVPTLVAEETPAFVEDVQTPVVEETPTSVEEVTDYVEENPAPVAEKMTDSVEETVNPETVAEEQKTDKAETEQTPKQEKRKNEPKQEQKQEPKQEQKQQKQEQKQQNVKPIPPFVPVRVETLVDLVNAPYRQLCLNDQQIQQLTVEDAQQRFRWFEGTLAWVLDYDIVISDTNIWLELLVGHTSSHSDPKVNARLLFERQLEFISKLVRYRGGKFMMMSETYEEIDRFATQQAPTNYKDADFTDEALCRNVAARLAKRLILSQQRENRLRIEGIGAESHHAAFADPAIIRKTVELFAIGKRVLLITNDASVAIRSMGMCDDLQRHNNIDDDTWEEVYTPLRPMVMTMDDLKVLDNFTRQYHFLQMAAGKQWMEDVPRRMEKHNVEPLMLWMEGFRPGDKHSEQQRQNNAQKQNGAQKQSNAQSAQQKQANAQQSQQKQGNSQSVQQRQNNTQQKQKAQKQQNNAQPAQPVQQLRQENESLPLQNVQVKQDAQVKYEPQPVKQEPQSKQQKQEMKIAEPMETHEQNANPLVEQPALPAEIIDVEQSSMSPSELIADCNNSVAEPVNGPKKRQVRRHPVRRRQSGK